MQYILLFIVLVFLIHTNCFENGFRSSYKYRKSGLSSIRTNRLQIEMKSSLYGSSLAKNIDQIRGPKAAMVRSIKKVFGSIFKFIQFVVNKILSAPKSIKTRKKESTSSTPASSSGIKPDVENSIDMTGNESRKNVNVNEKYNDDDVRVVPVSRVIRTPHEIREIERAKKIVESKLKEIEQSIETTKVAPTTNLTSSTTTIKTDPVAKEASMAPTEVTEMKTTKIESEIKRHDVITDPKVTVADELEGVPTLETDADINTDANSDAEGVLLEEVNKKIETITTATATVTNEGSILDSLEFGPVNPLSVVSSSSHNNDGGESISMEKVKAAGVSGIISYVGTEVVFWAFSLPLVISAYHSSTGEWLSISNAVDRGHIFALSATFITAIRLAVPLRLGVAVALTPWVEEKITKRYLISSDDDDNQKFIINVDAILQDLKNSSENISQYLKEHVQDSNEPNETGNYDRVLVKDIEMDMEVEQVTKQEEV